MSTVHKLDLDNTEHHQVDMNLVAALAIKRRWHLEFDCEGTPFVWDGPADNEAEAVAMARLAIYMDGRFDQDTARLAICFEQRRK